MASNRYKELMKQAQSEKIRLTRANCKEIKEMFKEVSKSLERKAVGAKRASLTERFMLDYKKAIDAELRQVRGLLYAKNKKAIEDAANATVQSQLSFLEEIDAKYSLGLDNTFRNAFSRVPQEAMNEILSGKMYKDRAGLSERIWADTKGMEKDIDYIIARGIAEKKSAYELAKDLQTYLDPDAKKDWEWSNVYPNTRKQIDYNAQRLARTSINHAFFNANMKSYAKNPFVEGVEWMLSDSHFERQIKPFGPDVCDEYAKHDEGLGTGVFPVDKVPLPHPMCLCTQAPYIPKDKDFNEIGEELGRWVRGESNPTLDAWYREFGREFAGGEKQDSYVYKFRKKESYSDWMDRQSKDMQQGILGKNKYILYKAGVIGEKDFDKPLSQLKEEGIITIKKSRLRHSVEGDFTPESRKVKGGGHGYRNIEILKAMGIEPEILKVFDNGVMSGNVPGHKRKWKREEGGQSWFPESWDDEKIHFAGTYVANKGTVDGNHIIGWYEDVKVRVIVQPDGEIGSIFPDLGQE